MKIVKIIGKVFLCNYSSIAGSVLTFFLLLSFNCNFWVNIKSQLFDSFIFILLGFSLGFLAKLLCFIILYGVVPTLSQINSQISAEKACHGYSCCNGICLVSVPDILKPDVPIPLSLLWPRLAGGFMRIIYFRDSVYLRGGGQRRVAARKILHYCIPPPHPGRIWPLWRGGGGGRAQKK